MKHIHVVPRTRGAALDAPKTHSTLREGARLGFIIGAVTWLWVAGFDLLKGQPFQTIDFLGGVAGFSLLHFALCLAYGITIIGAVHAAMKEPTVMFAIIFCAILFQAAFVVVTAMLANIGIGQPAWGRFLLGNSVAAALTFALVARDHPLRELFHEAEALQKN